MTEQKTELKQEREQIFWDVYSGKRPKRIPINMGATVDAAIEYFGYSLLRELYSPEKCFEVSDKMAELIDSDSLPVMPNTQAALFRYVGQRFMVPGADGFFQHPDLAPMEFDEYPEFISDTLGFIVDKIQPRVFEIVEQDPQLGHVKLKIAREATAAQFAGMAPKLIQKHQRASVARPHKILWAPFDFIADYIRSFSTILIDIRRNPQWVTDACEAVCDFQIKQLDALSGPLPGEISLISVPLHMAPFMRPKDVQKFWWPTFRRFITAVHQRGYMPSVFCEENWDAHLELLDDIEKRTLFSFETSDQKMIALKVPSRHIISHSYPTTLLRNGTKQQCIDTAKETVDNLAGNGNYIFSPNKSMIRGKDINISNIQAVIEFLKEYGKY